MFFYTTDFANTAAIREKEFGGLSLEVEMMREGAPEEAEMRLGGWIFSLIELIGVKKIGFTDYQAEAAEASADFISELEKQAAIGNHEARYHLFMEFHRKAMSEGSMDHLSRAENLLQASASQGYSEAISVLGDWSTLKGAAMRRIARLKAEALASIAPPPSPPTPQTL